jgi:hypothetical protein
MQDWAAELQQGRPEAAWDLFVSRYRRLIFATIRHYAQAPGLEPRRPEGRIRDQAWGTAVRVVRAVDPGGRQ